MEEVPIQFFQSVIAIQLAVTGALLFQIRYFSPGEKTRGGDERLPSATLRVAVAVLLGGTLFGSLLAMLHGDRLERLRHVEDSQDTSHRVRHGAARVRRHPTLLA